ncbi:MAG TPA: hypothetical protein VJH90_00005 [archaeon]|nr:hypothetical protein [archaeon]
MKFETRIIKVGASKYVLIPSFVSKIVDSEIKDVEMEISEIEGKLIISLNVKKLEDVLDG